MVAPYFNNQNMKASHKYLKILYNNHLEDKKNGVLKWHNITADITPFWSDIFLTIQGKSFYSLRQKTFLEMEKYLIHDTEYYLDIEKYEKDFVKKTIK